jgi:hypothetical protein
MAGEYRINEMDEKIKLIRKTAEELNSISGGIQAVEKNIIRLLASTKMLEINISDFKDFV